MIRLARIDGEGRADVVVEIADAASLGSGEWIEAGPAVRPGWVWSRAAQAWAPGAAGPAVEVTVTVAIPCPPAPPTLLSPIPDQTTWIPA